MIDYAFSKTQVLIGVMMYLLWCIGLNSLFISLVLAVVTAPMSGAGWPVPWACSQGA